MFCEFERSVFIFALEEVEHDIRFWAVRVEAAVIFICVVFVKYRSVFEFSDFEVCGVTVFTHHESLNAARLCRCVGVTVNGNKQVGVFFVGDLRSSEKRHRHIAVASINHIDVGTILLDVVACFFCDTQSDILFFRFHAYRTWVFAAMTSVNDNCFYLSFFLSLNIIDDRHVQCQKKKK